LGSIHPSFHFVEILKRRRFDKGSDKIVQYLQVLLAPVVTVLSALAANAMINFVPGFPGIPIPKGNHWRFKNPLAPLVD
tara:strand:- start:1719 stop:1955 length:237 start_codon:yes stop_codon:yes gene_type:complete